LGDEHRFIGEFNNDAALLAGLLFLHVLDAVDATLCVPQALRWLQLCLPRATHECAE
jgi:hypothetical protein